MTDRGISCFTETKVSATPEVQNIADLIAARIDARQQSLSDDLAYYAIHYQDRGELIKLRRQLWAVEHLLLERALRELLA